MLSSLFLSVCANQFHILLAINAHFLLTSILTYLHRSTHTDNNKADRQLNYSQCNLIFRSLILKICVLQWKVCGDRNIKTELIRQHDRRKLISLIPVRCHDNDRYDTEYRRQYLRVIVDKWYRVLFTVRYPGHRNCRNGTKCGDHLRAGGFKTAQEACADFLPECPRLFHQFFRGHKLFHKAEQYFLLRISWLLDVRVDS